MNTYNAVPHTKIHTEKPNELIPILIELGHKPEEGGLIERLNPELKDLTNVLSKVSEADMSKVVNYIVRESNRKKALLKIK